MTTNTEGETITTNDENTVNQTLSTDNAATNNEPVNADADSNTPESLSTVDEKNTNNQSEPAQVTSEENVNNDNQKEEEEGQQQETTPVVNDEIKSEVPSTTEINNASPNLYPPSPTNPIDEQERFNEVARKSFSQPDSENQLEASVPVTNNTVQTAAVTISESTKPKKSPAPILKPNVDDSTKTPTPTDTVITLETPVSTGDKALINTEPELVSPPPPTTPNKKQKSKVKTSLLSIPVALGYAITLSISIVKIIIGWTYADDCPIHWRIPHYLFVAGIIGIIIVILQFRVHILKICLKPKANEANGCFHFLNIILTFVWVILGFFLFGWFIAGCVWVFRVYNKVTYENPARSDYCQPILYRFAFWLLICTFLIPLFQIVIGIIKVCKLIKQQKKGTYSACATKE